MRIRKIILIIILLILSTGCKFRYEIEIIDDEVTEKRTMLINNNEIENNDIKGTIRKKISKYSINDDMMIAPSTKVVKETNNSGYQTITTYKISDYKNSDILNMCYTSYNIIKEDSKIYLTTGRKFTCFDTLEELESVEVIFKTNHEVIKHNADKVEDNKYTWYITKNNAKNKPINIELSEKKEENDPNKEKTTKFKIVFISIVAIFSIIVIIMLVIKRRRLQK